MNLRNRVSSSIGFAVAGGSFFFLSARTGRDSAGAVCRLDSSWVIMGNQASNTSNEHFSFIVEWHS